MFILEYGTFFPVSQFGCKISLYIHLLALTGLQNQGSGDDLPMLAAQ